MNSSNPTYSLHGTLQGKIRPVDDELDGRALFPNGITVFAKTIGHAELILGNGLFVRHLLAHARAVDCAVRDLTKREMNSVGELLSSERLGDLRPCQLLIALFSRRGRENRRDQQGDAIDGASEHFISPP